MTVLYAIPAAALFLIGIALAILVVGFCYLFGMANARTHLMMTSAVAVIVASMFVLIFELQLPFRGDRGIAPTSWSGFLAHVRLMDMAGPNDMRM